MDDLHHAHGINVALDAPALAEEGISPDTPVSLAVQDVPLRTALSLILRDADLAYVVKEVLVVTTPARARGKLTTVAYQVADLVIPLPGATTGKVAAPADRAPEEDRLIGLIRSTVAPGSWAEAGGPGTVDYYPLTMALVVNQTPDVQEQVADLLAALRRLQDQQVAFEVRFLQVSDETLEAVCAGLQKKELDPAPACGEVSRPTWTAFLSEAQVRRALERVQGDARSSVMQAPRLTVFNGQRSVVGVTDTQSFVTAVHVTTRGGKVVCVPQTEKVPLGVKLAVEPAVSADRRLVRVKLDATLTSLVSAKVPLFPVTLPVSPAGGDENAQPVMFTQFIQQPQLSRAAIDATLAIPDGGTVLLGGIKRAAEKRTEVPAPVLGKVPYVNRLFKNVQCSRETENVVVMVTPRIINQEEEEVQQAGCKDQPPARASGKLGKLLRRYHEACAAGHADEARKLAVECLAIDPTCFHAR